MSGKGIGAVTGLVVALATGTLNGRLTSTSVTASALTPATMLGVLLGRRMTKSRSNTDRRTFARNACVPGARSLVSEKAVEVSPTPTPRASHAMGGSLPRRSPPASQLDQGSSSLRQ